MNGIKSATILASVGAIALLSAQCVFADLISFTDNKGIPNDICDRTDVTGALGDPNATACVGFISGNDGNFTMVDWNTFDWAAAVATDSPSYVDPDNYNSTATSGLFGYTDWLGEAATGKGYKCDESAGCSPSNAYGDIGLSYDENTGEIAVDITGLAGLTQFAVILKQSSEYAAYLFESTVDFPLEYSWEGKTGSTTDLSHLTFIYRAPSSAPPEEEVPVPGTLLLLAAPLLGLSAWRRRFS